ncbi:MAG: acyl-CoA desaturase [Alphaproteobacteria bacterium]|nr:acyl-CoA desaturase [Alphaproteobacteria bacterium]MBU2082420.1 acyl-CoA desaturase [Alphaproteobacteria bacterium]MBU2141431.1 acyl-CoA desaturase [Alphaproteobacteria bacterium]MBU2197369.1 acyl-CoA desaturase [Alphaproteobacteria bacterium]
MTPRSLAIPKTWKTFDVPSFFSAFGYPALGLGLFITMVVLGFAVSELTFHWWYLPLAFGVIAFSVFMCNAGIGPLHRILQHRAGELKAPAQFLTMLNLILAMQGNVKDWVNYHSQHHRFADGPGDPHNPFESKRWAWVGWILWRDKKDTDRPIAMWLKGQPVIVWMDRFYNEISLVLHLFIPAAIYLIVWASGGSLVLTALIHASVVIGRAIQFHATVYGINVLGHLKTPIWADHLMALLTGGEAFHDHHHDAPISALHRPRKGVWNRIVDYNGTILLAFEKIGWVKNLKIAPQFA